MIKKVKLKNYKSFKDFEFEIKEYMNAQNIALIYGENGSGKSNLISSFNFLTRTLSTFGNIENYNRLIHMSTEKDLGSTRDIIDMMIIEFGLKEQISNARRIGIDTKDTMELEFLFDVKDMNFTYSLVFDAERVIKETLNGPLKTNSVEIFNIDYNDSLRHKINLNLFSNEYNNEIDKLLTQYFGKHTLLSILNYEINQKNTAYIKSNINNNFLSFIDYLKKISIIYNDTSYDVNTINSDNRFVSSLSKGSINENEFGKLVNSEKALNLFFSSLYSSVKSVTYKTEKNKNKLKYELYFNKIVGGKITSVPINYESRGTKKLLELFPYLFNLLNGGIVIIDELETGIHDVLMSTLVEHLTETAGLGQLIATTHNTMLLEIVDKKNVYILDSDDKGNGFIYNLSNSKTPIQKNHSLYNNYKKGAYGGIPIPGYFDFEDLKHCLDEDTGNE
ncbi:MAG: AAA family ATPase [Acholeplasmataceae bacterium]|nr:AAA family ATPase [Acholeplasmataceae bacterium]MDD4204053.1 AAA family ATPase [Acholeplasmataceae bacterium]MDD4469460.1 AAA family ATPase [Acholeplasmataceae bacterium]MDD4824047.1 AAA family ATPase [Acholeplasmataceae bacterium]MDY0316407.1 AAA family ATPase [Acholeplasmatales bacterium]